MLCTGRRLIGQSMRPRASRKGQNKADWAASTSLFVDASHRPPAANCLAASGFMVIDADADTDTDTDTDTDGDGDAMTR